VVVIQKPLIDSASSLRYRQDGAVPLELLVAGTYDSPVGVPAAEPSSNVESGGGLANEEWVGEV